MCVSFDYSSSYLAVGCAKSVRVYGTAKAKADWPLLCELGASTSGAVSAARFSRNSSFLVTAAADRTVRFFGSA